MISVESLLQTHYPKVASSGALRKPAHYLLRHLLHEKEMLDFAQRYPHVQGLDFVEQVLDEFSVSYSVRDKERENIPTEGRLVIIANHPIGSLDALALIKMLSEVRQDIKVVANNLLLMLQPLESVLLPVNNMLGGTPRAHLKAIHQHLNDEGAVLIFPAGEVSRLRPQGVRDTQWQNGFLKMALRCHAPVLPIFIDGKNSPLFYGVSMLYKPLATGLLVSEMFKQKHTHLPMRVGRLIPTSSFAHLGLDHKTTVKLFKRHLYRIGTDKPEVFKTQSAIALPENRQVLSQAIRNQCEQLGETHDGKQILLYRHSGSSVIMREIGRLREIAFRAVGEGSNLKRDIDHYDQDYIHLILWDKDDLEIAGAYRIGELPKIVAEKGISGLYSASLFEYHKGIEPYFENALELGRSFVQPKYWGKRSLDYLWFGIGAFLKRHPQYRYLIGPVSLSSHYPLAAQQLIVQFYQAQFPASENLATPKTPFVLTEDTPQWCEDPDYKTAFRQLKHQLAYLDVCVPTLYKQYAETYEAGGVQFLAFNLDHDFNDCIDGLILADINKMTRSKRQRYLS